MENATVGNDGDVVMPFDEELLNEPDADAQRPPVSGADEGSVGGC